MTSPQLKKLLDEVAEIATERFRVWGRLLELQRIAAVEVAIVDLDTELQQAITKLVLVDQTAWNSFDKPDYRVHVPRDVLWERDDEIIKAWIKERGNRVRLNERWRKTVTEMTTIQSRIIQKWPES